MEIRRDDMTPAGQPPANLLRNALHRHGVIKSTIAVSLVCIVSSMIIPWLWWSMINPELVRFGIMTGVICSSILAPPLMYALSNLSSELDRSEEAVRHTHEQLQGTLDNARELSGMLRICASCKKVRDDKGYWSQVEIYLHDHSRAAFSHSICPSCYARHYPELLEADT